MMLRRFGLILVLAVTACGCAIGAPERASDIQNLNGISDDISAVSMTQSNSAQARDPNARTTLPHNYETSYTR